MLTERRVEEIFLVCLIDDGEDTTNFVAAEGIIDKVGFHPGRLESYKAEIGLLVDELPDKFKSKNGDSFLAMCNDKHDNQWTGLHRRMSQLLQLGLATGRIEYGLPREYWRFLPGGMPIILVKPS